MTNPTLIQEIGTILESCGGSKKKALARIRDRARESHDFLLYLLDDKLTGIIMGYLRLVEPNKREYEVGVKIKAEPPPPPRTSTIGLPVTILRGIQLMAESNVRSLFDYRISTSQGDVSLGDAGLDEIREAINISTRTSTKLQIEVNWLRRVANKLTPTQTVRQIMSPDELEHLAHETEREMERELDRMQLMGAR